jgi:hypothetical protein
LKGRYLITILGELITVSVPKPINKIIAISMKVIIPIKKDLSILTDTSVSFKTLLD